MADENTGPDGGNQGGDEETSFLDSLPEDLREEPSLQDFQDVSSLAKSYVHAQKLVGHDKLPLPNSDDDELAWNEVYSRLGRPEDASGYEIGGPDPEEDGFELDESAAEKFKEAAHKAGLNPKQAQEMMDFNLDFIRGVKAEASQALERRYDASVAELRKELGATYDEKIGLANRALDYFGGDEVVDMLEKYGLDNDPNMVRMFIKIGDEIGEDRFGEAAASMGGMAPAEAKGEIAKLKTDERFMKAYTDRYNPGHQDAVQRMQELYKYAYPS